MSLLSAIIRLLNFFIVLTIILLALSSCQKSDNIITSSTTNNIGPEKTPINTPQNTPTSNSSESTINYIDENVLATADIKNKFSLDDLSVYDVKTNKQIKLGMTKQEVGKALGIQNPKKDGDFFNYNGLNVFFRNNTVAALHIKSKNTGTPSRFATNRMIGISDKIEEIRKTYGQGYEYKESSYLYVTYSLEKSKNALIIQDTQNFRSKGQNNPEKLYTIDFILKQNQVFYILISDYQYAYTFS